MEGFGGPAQPSPTIGQGLNGGYGWLEVMCRRCETRASIPLDAVRRPRNTPIWKLEAALKCRSCRTPRYAPPDGKFFVNASMISWELFRVPRPLVMHANYRNY
jgi:hypothetical protein